MDSTKFPINIGMDLSGKQFLDVLEKNPKITEFVRELWIESKCSGVFLEFLKYVQSKFKNPLTLHLHKQRCYKLVKTMDVDKIPCYLRKYIVKTKSTDDLSAS